MGIVIAGQVVSAQGRLIDDGRRIVTDVVIRTPDGDVTVMARGGRAGGFGQVSWPAPPIPEVGASVSVDARPWGSALVADDVTFLSRGPLPFVRTGPTEAGNYLSWASGCAFMTYDAAGTEDLAGETEFDVLDQALARWSSAVDTCSYLTLMSMAPEAGDIVGNDGVNRVIFRDDRWCRPAHDGMPEECLQTGAAGLTTVTYVDDMSSSRDGEIVDADVEFNGEEFSISDNGTTEGTMPCLADLGATATHELGHVMGLDHTCLAPGDPPKIDGDGQPVPLCSLTSDPDITEATMYNFQECGETKKQSPEQDDIDAVCDAYPRDADPETCAPIGVRGGCCSTSGGGSGSALLLTSLLGAVAYRRRRRG